ncbi:MAG: hypothetical protein K0U93_13625 [Gammaproteobacteria bacterium]|nr:hypothetical protein [Gammaproteobacteria bacterium]
MTSNTSDVRPVTALSAVSFSGLCSALRDLAQLNPSELRSALALTCANFSSQDRYRVGISWNATDDLNAILDSVAGELEGLTDTEGVRALSDGVAGAFVGIGQPRHGLGLLVAGPAYSNAAPLAPNLAEQYIQALAVTSAQLGVDVPLPRTLGRAHRFGCVYRALFKHFAVELEAVAGEGLGELSALALAGRIARVPRRFDEAGRWPDSHNDAQLLLPGASDLVVYCASLGAVYPDEPAQAYEHLMQSVLQTSSATGQLQRLADHGVRTVATVGPQRGFSERLQSYSDYHNLGIDIVDMQRGDVRTWSTGLAHLLALGYATQVAPVDAHVSAAPVQTSEPLGADTRAILERLLDSSQDALATMSRSELRSHQLQRDLLASQRDSQRTLEALANTQTRLVDAIEMLQPTVTRSTAPADTLTRRTYRRFNVTDLGHRELVSISKGAEFWIADATQRLGPHIQDALRIHQIPARLVDITARPRGQRISGLLFIAPPTPSAYFLREMLALLQAFNASLDGIVRRRTVVLLAMHVGDELDEPPLARALAGLRHCAREVAPWSRFKVLEIDAGSDDDTDLTAEIADEVLLDGPLSVKIADGARFASTFETQALDHTHTSLDALGADDTLAVLSTAGGFTADLALGVARLTGCSLALLGPEPISEPDWLSGSTSPQEIRQTLAQQRGLHAANGLESEVRHVLDARHTRHLLARIAHAGIRAEYFAVESGLELHTTLTDAADRLGPITGALFDARSRRRDREPPAEPSQSAEKHDNDVVDDVIERIAHIQSFISAVANQPLKFCAAIGATHESGSSIATSLALEASANLLMGLNAIQTSCTSAVVRWDVYSRLTAHTRSTSVTPQMATQFLSEVAAHSSELRFVELAAATNRAKT